MNRISILIAFSLLISGTAYGETGRITGTVTLESGETVPGTTVFLSPLDVKSVSDSEGKYEFPSVGQGMYEITFQLQGFGTQTRKCRVKSGETAIVNMVLKPLAFTADSVIVSAPYTIFQEDTQQNVSLDRDRVESMPHAGDDLFRVVGCLPGIVSNDISSNFSIRGGLPREGLVLLDGIEIFEPFHLKEFLGVFSIVDPEIVGNMDLVPGGFTVEYGDRSSGVLSIDTYDPGEISHSAGVGISSMWLNSSGVFNRGDGFWLVSLRRGYLDIVMDLVGEEEEGETQTIRYWDTFGKMGYRFSGSNTLTLSFLASDDVMDMEERSPDEFLDLDSRYGNGYLWLTHEGLFRNSMFIESRLYGGRITGYRSILDDEHGDASEILDDRDVTLYGARQDWKYCLNSTHYLKWGAEFRQFKAGYDYASDFEFGHAIPDDRFIPPAGDRTLNAEYTGEQYSAYAADQMTLFNHLTAELGLRFDHYSISNENVVSPRINLVYDLGDNRALRAGWGQYYQSHKPNELDVQDGETEFYDAERTRQLTAGYESVFGDSFRVRCDAYYRVTDNPRPRYENVFEVFAFSPEARPDRVRIVPDRTVARGVELFASSRISDRFDWWLNYAWSSVKDDIDGREMYRNNDQTHAVKLSLNYHPTRQWDVNLTWHYHTGWPKTLGSAEYRENDTGETVIVPVVGDFYTDRYPKYHRLDLRINYTVPFKRTLFTFYIDVQNLYDRRNVSGFSLAGDVYREHPDGTVDFVPEEETWLGILPSFGVKWSF